MPGDFKGKVHIPRQGSYYPHCLHPMINTIQIIGLMFFNIYNLLFLGGSFMSCFALCISVVVYTYRKGYIMQQPIPGGIYIPVYGVIHTMFNT